MEDGLKGALDILENLGVPGGLVSAVRVMIETSLKISDSKRIMKTLLFPHLKMTNEELVNAYSPIREWSTSWIRAMAWHPRLPRLALALRDDSVKICINEPSDSVLPVLKAPEQKCVSCIAWHPYVNEFVLGVESGYIVWNLYPSVKTAFPTSDFTGTVGVGHAPVTSVDYSRNGDKMLTSSPADTCILIWNLGTGCKTQLYRLSCGGVPRAVFSPNPATEIFANTPGNDFRVWEYDHNVVRPKTWRTAKSPVEAFAWHPSGQFLCFVSDSLLFRLTISFTGDHAIHPVFDLGQVAATQESTTKAMNVGGKVLKIEWDPTGVRLLILFADSPIIPVLRLLPGKNTCLVPCGFVSGEAAEYPVGIAFQKDFKHGAILTIAWSTERLQYFPFIFTPIQIGAKIKSALNPDCRIFSNLKEFPERLSEKNETNGLEDVTTGAGDSFRLFYDKY